MICEYTTNFDDFKAAQRLCIRKSRSKTVLFFLFQRLMPVLAVGALGLLIWDTSHRHFEFPPLVGGVLAAIAWLGLYCPIMRPFQLRRLYRAMKNGRADSDPLVLEWNNSEMISRVPGLSEGRFFPAAIHDFQEDQDIALIYLAKNRFLMVPKRAMPEEVWAQFRLWLAKSRETTR